MNKERWRLLEELFHAALEHPEDGRRQFLEEACGGDAELRAEVESLLGSDPETGSGTTTGSSMIADRVRRAAVLVAFPPRQGDRIGRYRVVEEIGHGGMGLVYRATRADQEFDMQVAIKVARTGMDTATVLERFRRERQILASLDHRYVAKLLDGGTTDDGLPYFVMEYVEGQPIHKYAQAKNLTVRDRLILFRNVLEAVAYAHQNLVVHLDLKPSNILIAADGSPKLLDFGIARLLDPKPVDSGPAPEVIPLSDVPMVGSSSSTTALGRLLTPDYASPEQVRGETLTTATDVYSLGVVLYQLLTGELPHDLEGLSPRQTERVICALDVPRPSERSPRLRRELAGDIDNIVMKAMTKDPARRYRSAQELDEELRRHLNGLPVRALGGSRLYHLRKFLWRNRLAAVAGLAVFLSLLGGLVVAQLEARRADAQRRVAELESGRAERNAAQAQHNAREAQANAHRAETATEAAEKALHDAKAAQAEAITQRTLADERFEEVRKLSTAYLFDFNDALANSPGTLPVRRRMVDLGIGFLDGLAKQAGNNAKLRSDLAAAYMRLGDLLGNPDKPNLGDTKAALQSYRKALAMLVETHPQRDPSQKETDDSLLTQAELHNHIGEVLEVVGPVRESLAEHKEAVRLARDLLSRHEGDLRFDLPIAKVLVGNSHTLVVQDAPQASLAALKENRPILSKLLELHPGDPGLSLELASDYSTEGRVTALAGDLRGSVAAYHKEIDLIEGLERKFPGDSSRTRMLMFAYSHLGDMLGNPQFPNLGDYAGAVTAYERMSHIADATAAVDKENAFAQLDAAMSAGRLGGLRLSQGDPAAALPPLQKAVTGLEAVVARDPNNRSNAVYFSANAELAGDAEQALAKFKEAETYYARSIAVIEPVTRADPKNLSASANLTESYLKFGLALSQEGNRAALERINAALMEVERLHGVHPEDPRVTLRWARCFGGRALAGYRLAMLTGVSAEARAEGLRQARQDVRRADEIVAGVPEEQRRTTNARTLMLISEARELLAQAP
jgi:eukaryotic-like serine/threonine-protein kinase